MKILFITSSYPPFMDMQTIRNLKLIDGLIDKGHKITVLSPSRTLNEKIEKKQNVDEWKTKPPLFFQLTDFVEKKIKSKFLMKILNVFGGKFLFPDVFALWSKQALKFLKTKDINNFDLAITSSGSFTSHFIGSSISKKNSIDWIADYGDPWSLDKYGNIKFLVKFFERKVLKNCSLIFFTTHSTIKFYNLFLDKYNIKKDLVFLPCGYDTMPNYEIVPKKNKQLSFTYTGVAYSQDRNLSNAILAVGENKEDAYLNIVGSYSSKYENILNVENIVNFKGRVSYEQSLTMILESDVLLHIGNFGALQIPGKTYIYLSAPKPILYIRQETGYDPTFELLSKFEGIVICENSISDIDRAIKEIVQNYNGFLTLSQERVMSEELKQFEWINVNKMFNNAIAKFEK